MSDEAGPRRTPGAESGRRLLLTLRAFRPDRPAPTAVDLADEIGVPVSTMYRYLAVLRETGLVEPDGAGGFRLTDAVTTLAQAADASRVPLVDAARPHLTALRDAIDETVLLARRGGDYAYCIAREDSRHPVRLQFAVGQAMPLHAGSVARVLLSAVPAGERAAYLRPILATNPPNAERLTDAALADTAAAGWTQSYEEVDAGIWGCAAAITVDGDVVAALGTAGPIYRLDEERRTEVIDAVRHTAAAIGAALTRP